MSISCTDQEVKLVMGSQGKERLTRLCSAYGKPFPFMIKGRRVEKEAKRYQQILPAVWKAEKWIPEVDSRGSSREEVVGSEESKDSSRKCKIGQGEN